MEENKEKENKCCESGTCNQCCCCCTCCKWMKSHPAIKKLLVVLAIVLAFCLGFSLAENRNERFEHNYGCAKFMRVNLGDESGFGKMWQDEATVSIIPEIPTPPTGQ